MSVRGWRAAQWLAFASGGIPASVALLLIWVLPAIGDSPAMRWTLTLIVVLAWLGLGFVARERLSDRLRTMANIVTAIREGDYTVRARSAEVSGPLAELAHDLNQLGSFLQERRLSGKEAEALLLKVLEEIDSGILAFDAQQQVRLANRTACRWIGRPAAQIVGVSARALGLTTLLEGDPARTCEIAFRGRAARYRLRRAEFREEGQPHVLVVLTDLSQTLAEEERLAWKRLIQVLRHEINNSLAPIQSMSGTLRGKLARSPRPEGWEEDLNEGLELIESRSASLSRLMADYARLTRLPAPNRQNVDVAQLVARAVSLEERMTVQTIAGPLARLDLDPDQIEQVLINVLRNAVDAALEVDGDVAVSWDQEPDGLVIRVRDSGPGLASKENLFVPFFSTKPGGSGIGLPLSRQIVEAHGGTLNLDNRSDARGCLVEIRLPPAPVPASR